MSADAIIPGMTVEEFGALVRETREARRLSRQELAQQVGIAEVTLERLETRQNPPRPRRPTVIDLARTLAWDTNEALQWLDYPPLTAVEVRELKRRQPTADPLDRVTAAWPRITPPQREAVARVAETMANPQSQPPQTDKATHPEVDNPGEDERSTYLGSRITRQGPATPQEPTAEQRAAEKEPQRPPAAAD